MGRIFSFYNLLKYYRIEIPIIQRDYAQGRESKVYLRNRFLTSLVESLHNNKPLSLDFVYGTNEHGAIWPLDGQQRLTTLWLLHWCLALRTGNLESTKNWLANFTYETRTSSREFCSRLCSLSSADFEKKRKKRKKRKKIADYIKDQTWFYSSYYNDPTIMGMLRTLGGTSIANSNDGIEELKISDDDCSRYWAQLLSKDCPITFMFMDMKDENMPLSDDLYIKMNARGKQLSDFENFKADLIGFAPNADNPNDKLIDTETAALIDNQWTDEFWKAATAKGVYNVDDIYLEFLRRYFLNWFIAKAKSTGNVNEITSSRWFGELYDGKQYEGMNNYRDVLKPYTIKSLSKFFENWNDTRIVPHWKNGEPFSLIPQYDDESKVTGIENKKRVVFYAVCSYFEENDDFCGDNFNQWQRFVWNIVENGDMSKESMVSAIRLVEELRPYCGDITSFLASEVQIKSNFASRQIDEEREKAHLIKGKDGVNWLTLIHEAENMPFFKGNIACLLRDKDGKFSDDIEYFKKKLSNAKNYFGDEAVNKKYALPLTKTLIKLLHDWNQLYNKYLFDTSSDAWKRNLLNNSDYYAEVDKLFMAEDLSGFKYEPIVKDGEEWTESADKIKRIMSETSFLDGERDYGKIVCSGSVWRLRWTNRNLLAFYPDYKRNAYTMDWVDGNYSFRRNELLAHKNIEVDEYNEASGGVFWGWEIYFTYNGHRFYWNCDSYKVHILDENGNCMHNGKKDNEYLCIDMNEFPNITQTDFLRKLSQLAEVADNL